MLLINLLLVMISVWIIFVLNYKFIQPAFKNKQRFKLYKLRDELSILAMKGILDERSEYYLTLINIQNSAISASSSFKVTDFLRFLVDFNKDEKMKNKLSTMVDNISKTDNAEYCRIASDTFNVIHNLMNRDTRVLRYMFFPLFLLGNLLALVKCNIPKQRLNSSNHTFKEVGKNLDGYSHGFREGCIAR